MPQDARKPIAVPVQ